MALTLVEAAKLETGDVHRQAIIELFARSSDLLAAMPFDNILGNAFKYNQEEALPGIGFRAVNEAYSDQAVGVINPEVESLVIAGGDLDVDTFIVKTMGSDQRAVREAMKVKALAHSISHKMIKGDSTVTDKEFDGLQVRLSGNQLIAVGSPASGGDVLSLETLDETIDAVDDGNALFMSKAMRRTLTAASRNQSVGGHVRHEINDFGKQVTFYNDLPILIADNNGDQFATLAFDEVNPGGGSNVGTSIYCLALGEGMLQGIQNGGMDVRDLGELQAGTPAFRTRIEWYVSLLLAHPRAAARYHGIKSGSAVA